MHLGATPAFVLVARPITVCGMVSELLASDALKSSGNVWAERVGCTIDHDVLCAGLHTDSYVLC